MNDETTQNGVGMDAGRELDARIAEAFFGWTVEWNATPHPGFDRAVKVWAPGREEEGPTHYSWCFDRTGYAGSGCITSPVLPCYSTDIAAAWEVRKAMGNHPDPRFRNLTLVSWCYNRTYATFDALAFSDYDPATWAEANGEHATPLAICRAALLACEAR